MPDKVFAIEINVCCVVCQTLTKMNNVSVEAADSRLNMSAKSINETLQRHLPSGVPTTNSSTCLLAHEDYITGYSDEFHMPLWAAFTISPVIAMLIL